MRVASWAFVLCAVLIAVGAFLPSLQLRVRGAAISKHTGRSLYQVSNDRALVRRMLATYHGSGKRKLGGKIVRSVAPRVTGRPRAALEDARDAMDTLDELTDADVKNAGLVLTIALWTLIGLEAGMIALVFGELMRGSYRRWRLVLALLGSLVTAGIAIALHIVCREAAWQANDEAGRTIVTLGPGAYVMPLAAIAALVAAVVLVARHRRTMPSIKARAR